MQQLHVDRSAIRSVKIVEVPEMDLKLGQARLKVERLSLTANTLTYAVAGEAIGYWKFFPMQQECWGIVPAWGFALLQNLPDNLRSVRAITAFGQLPHLL